MNQQMHETISEKEKKELLSLTSKSCNLEVVYNCTT
jgi:hypothetical protein